MMVTKLFLSPLLVNSRWSKLNRNKLLEFSKQNEQQNALRIQQMELNSYLQIQLFTLKKKKKKVLEKSVWFLSGICFGGIIF